MTQRQVIDVRAQECPLAHVQPACFVRQLAFDTGMGDKDVVAGGAAGEISQRRSVGLNGQRCARAVIAQPVDAHAWRNVDI